MAGGQRAQALIAQVEALVTQIDGIVEILNEHDHSIPFVAPDLADALTLNPAGGAWGITGALVEIIPAGAMAQPFDIHWAHVVGSGNDQYQFFLLAGLAGFETIISKQRWERTNVQSASEPLRMMCPIQPAGTRITARVATSSGGNSMTIAIQGHMY